MPFSTTGFYSRLLRSRWHALAASLICGVAVALIKGILLLKLVTIWRVGVAETAVIDVVVTAVGVALVVGILLAIIRQRRKAVMEQLEKVATLNHHVRNDLQVIVYQTALSQDSTEAVQRITGAVAHIDSTLRTLFPNAIDAEESKTGLLKKRPQSERPRQSQPADDQRSR